METRLKITWDGETPGLAQHRLSLAAFGPALNALLKAMRRIASGMLTKVEDPRKAGLRGGRLAKLATQIDLEVTEVEEGSLGLVLACVLRLAPGQNADLFHNLTDKTCTEFVDAVAQETAGQPCNGRVREYLRSLPPGVKSQSYELKRSDGEERRVQVGAMALATLPAIAPGLESIVAHVVGVGFEPGRPEVRLEYSGGRPLVCTASPALVERAIALRNQAVHALVVSHGNKVRLLRLRSADEAEPVLDSAERETLLWDRWDALLRRFPPLLSGQEPLLYRRE